MHWKLKAKIQNAISRLPPSVSYEIYYWVQRSFGAWGSFDTSSRLKAGIDMWNKIQEQGRNPSGKVFLEVGTGRVPLAPLAYWLMGAEKTITIDVNPYVKQELIAESIRHISTNKDEIINLFGPLLNQERFHSLLEFCGASQRPLSAYLDFFKVDYIASGNAADTHLPSQSIDFHTSYTVFEHIPEDVLKKILKEGNRIIKEDGLFVHQIDYGDHFSYSDKNISLINFLQYSDAEWEGYAGNRYMYMNRLRHDDFIKLFESAGQRIITAKPKVDQRVQALLKSGKMPLNERFSSKTEEVLATVSAWMITQKIT